MANVRSSVWTPGSKTSAARVYVDVRNLDAFKALLALVVHLLSDHLDDIENGETGPHHQAYIARMKDTLRVAGVDVEAS